MTALVIALAAGVAVSVGAGLWQFRVASRDEEARTRGSGSTGEPILLRRLGARDRMVTIGYNGALFLAMIGGILANYFWVRGFMQPIQVDELWKPFLIAPIVFLPVYAAATKQPRGLIPVLLAFQNGFFWQTVFEKIPGNGAG